MSIVVVACGAGAATTSLPAVPDVTEVPLAVVAAPDPEASMACPDGDSEMVEHPVSSSDDGAITREMLDEGTRLLVTDEAIAAANDPVFTEARQTWDSVSSLVAQIDYQLTFCGYVDYMSTDLAHIAGLLVKRPVNMGSQSMGLDMSEAEVAEMQRRDELGDRMEEIVVLVTGVDESTLPEGDLPDYGPNFGGISMDQLDGGRIVLAVVDASIVPVNEAAAILGGADQLRVIEQPFTYNQVEEFRRQLEAELEALGMARDIAAVWSERGRLLEVRVADPASFPESVGAGLPEGAFTVVEGPTVEEANLPGETGNPGSTGCDRPATEATPPAVTDATKPVSSLSQADLRMFDAGSFVSDAAFWASLANPTAFEVERYEAVEEMSSLASVVIVGRVTEVKPTRTIREPGVEGGDVTYWGMEVEVVEVLRGQLEPASGDAVITLESFAIANDDLPTGAAIMFLRHKLDPPPGGSLTGPIPEGEEDKCRLVSSQGLFINSPEGARNPISEALHGVIADGTGGTVLDPQHEDDEPVDPVAEQVYGMSMADLIAAIQGT